MFKRREKIKRPYPLHNDNLPPKFGPFLKTEGANNNGVVKGNDKNETEDIFMNAE